MFYRSVLWILIFCSCHWYGVSKRTSHDDSGESDLGLGLIASLKDDANLDLSVDEEYEDLRAELLAYQAALAAVISRNNHRRSLMTTPCWQAGGICINYKLCKGTKYITQAAGCRDRHNVCCFAWNRYFVRDFRDKGLPNLGLPWASVPQEFGGKGIQGPEEKPHKNKKRKNKKSKKLKLRFDETHENFDDDWV